MSIRCIRNTPFLRSMFVGAFVVVVVVMFIAPFLNREPSSPFLQVEHRTHTSFNGRFSPKGPPSSSIQPHPCVPSRHICIRRIRIDIFERSARTLIIKHTSQCMYIYANLMYAHQMWKRRCTGPERFLNRTEKGPCQTFVWRDAGVYDGSTVTRHCSGDESFCFGTGVLHVLNT